MIGSFNRATLTGVEMGNAFGDDDAFLATNADCPWVEVAVIIASGLKVFNGTLHHAMVI